MNPQEIAKSYDQLADHWSSDQLNRSNGIEQHQRALQFTDQRGYAIDVGCGSSRRITALLLAQGFTTEALDISPEMVRQAKAAHPEVTHHLANICEWEFPRRYDFISAWDSIWHAPLERHESLLTKLCSGLTEGGILIFTCGGTTEPSESTNPFLDQPLYHATLGIPKILEVVSQSDCVCRHLEYDQYPEKHVYLIVQKIESILGSV